MDQHVETVAVEHQPLDDGLKLVGLEDDLSVGDRMRPDWLVAKAAELDLELLADDGAHALGGRTRLLRIVVDVRVIASVRDGVGHQATSAAPRFLANSSRSASAFFLMTG